MSAIINKKNKFEEVVEAGDWHGYKNLVRQEQEDLSNKLMAKFSPLKTLNRLLVSKSWFPQILGTTILLFIWGSLCWISFITGYNQVIQVLLGLTLVIGSVQLPLIAILLTDNYKKVINPILKTICVLTMILPKCACIIVQHSIWIGLILLKNKLNVFYFLKRTWQAFSAVYTITAIYVAACCWIIKYLKYDEQNFLLPLLFLLVVIAWFLTYSLRKFNSNLIIETSYIASIIRAYLIFMELILSLGLFKVNLEEKGSQKIIIISCLLSLIVYSLQYIFLNSSLKGFCEKCGKECDKCK